MQPCKFLLLYCNKKDTGVDKRRKEDGWQGTSRQCGYDETLLSRIWESQREHNSWKVNSWVWLYLSAVTGCLLDFGGISGLRAIKLEYLLIFAHRIRPLPLSEFRESDLIDEKYVLTTKINYDPCLLLSSLTAKGIRPSTRKSTSCSLYCKSRGTSIGEL